MTDRQVIVDRERGAIERCALQCTEFILARQALCVGADEDEIEEFQTQIVAARMIRNRILALIDRTLET